MVWVLKGGFILLCTGNDQAVVAALHSAGIDHIRHRAQQKRRRSIMARDGQAVVATLHSAGIDHIIEQSEKEALGNGNAVRI